MTEQDQRRVKEASAQLLRELDPVGDESLERYARGAVPSERSPRPTLPLKSMKTAKRGRTPFSMVALDLLIRGRISLKPAGFVSPHQSAGPKKGPYPLFVAAVV
jgi:hypothetical protein